MHTTTTTTTTTTSSSSSNGTNIGIKTHHTPITSSSTHHYERTVSYNRTSIKRTVTTRKTYVVIVGFSLYL